jgi:hypothetical protein
MWRSPTAGEVLTLGGIALSAYGLAVAGVTRTRRGDLWDFAAVRAWWELLWTSGRAAQVFRHSAAAQRWSLWREKLVLVPAWLLALLSLAVAGYWLLGLLDTRKAIDLMIGMSLVPFLLLIPMVFGLVIGSCGKGRLREMRHFQGTLPVSDAFLARALLRSCATVLLLAVGTWLVGLILMAGLACLAGHRDDVVASLMPSSFGITHAVMLFLIAPLFSWTFTALMATLVATGRPWLWAGVLGGAFGTGIALALAQEYLSPAVFEIVSSGWLLLSGSLYLAGTAWAFATALRRGHLTIRTVLPAVVGEQLIERLGARAAGVAVLEQHQRVLFRIGQEAFELVDMRQLRQIGVHHPRDS